MLIFAESRGYEVSVAREQLNTDRGHIENYVAMLCSASICLALMCAQKYKTVCHGFELGVEVDRSIIAPR